MTAVDTNILVYAHRRESRHHDRAAEVVRAFAEGAHRWAIPWPCVYEFFSVVTNPRIWKDAASTVVPRQIQQIDGEMRQEVGRRFADAVRDLVTRGDGQAQLAAANLITEMGPTVRALGKDNTAGFARSLTKEVIQLSRG